MAETLAKVWFKHEGNLIEVTGNTDGIVYDVYPSKWKLVKKNLRILYYIIFTKQIKLASKEEFIMAVGKFIDNYYEDEIFREMLKTEIQEELLPNLKEQDKDKNPSYIG